MWLFKDIDERQFWLTLWSLCICGVVTIAFIINWNSYQEDMIVKGLVEKGYDPLELACLYNPSERNESACLIISQRKAGLIVTPTKAEK